MAIKPKSTLRKAISAAGSSLMQSGQDEMDRTSGYEPAQYRHGGKVRKTGVAIVHKGERVIPASKRKKVERLMKRSKIRMRTRR